jgi:hypothetical protein
MIVIPITESELIYTVSSIKNKNSFGYDGVSNKILRLCGNFSANHLPIFSIYL